MTLEHKQFEFRGVPFGPGLMVDVDEFSREADDFETQDTPHFRDDSIGPGVDSRRPGPWRWSIFTLHETFAEGQEALAELQRVWNDRVLRRTPGEVYPLRYARRRLVDGAEVVDTRVVFGRPRRFEAARETGVTDLGLFQADLEFAVMDNLYYSDLEYVVGIPSPTAAPTGIIFPFELPLLTTEVAEPAQDQVGSTGGDAPSPFTAEFVGPVTNPVLSCNAWELRLNRHIPLGESVTVSTYPWGSRAVTSSGADVSGHLSSGTRLSALRIPPSGTTLHYNGHDISGASMCYVRWRAAFETI